MCQNFTHSQFHWATNHNFVLATLSQRTVTNMERYIHFSRIFPCNKCLYHVQVGYLLLWLFGAPYLIFSLSDVWRSYQNYHSMEYSTETAANMIICDSSRQWIICVTNNVIWRCSCVRIWKFTWNLEYLVFYRVMALHSYWWKKDNGDSDMPITLSW